ncbi:hypothetical protein M408DRAFT_329067 [Serendipita vermifera MAFF 305830]|uniref:Mid2 domain-containing protein n=1 Tax=Serendipita vermifera MAFF 305830 TaxID=933852 RepID=A0A0C2WSB1_SERVB|nr:hypothetical protein M408DRAFT_329067 [Serendipita vermifera MAFF 305830]
MWLSLVLALSVHSAAALLLTGPASITACNVVEFGFSDGIPPYTFHPILGGVEQSALGTFNNNNTSYAIYIGTQSGIAMEFYATDSTQAISNTLSYTVQDGGVCSSSTSRASTYSTTPTETPSTYMSITTYNVSISAPTVAITSTSSSRLVNVTTHYETSTATTITGASGPFSSSNDTSSGIILTKSAILAIIGTLVGALLLAIGFCFWRWRRRRAIRGLQRRDQGTAVMNHANLNHSGALLTSSSPIANRTSHTGTPDMPNPLTHPNVLPSSKELRMRGAVYREQDLEDGSSISDASGPLSTANSTSIWPDASDVQQEGSSSQMPPRPHNQQSLQALIGRELENILQNPRHQDSPTSFTGTPSPFSSLNDVQSSVTSETEQSGNPFSEKPPLSLTIPHSHRDARSILPSATTPISRRDMEVLADLVAQRLIRDRTPVSPTHGHNPAIPPPSYS